MDGTLKLPVVSGDALKLYQDQALERLTRSEGKARASWGKPRCIQLDAKRSQEAAIALCEEFGLLGKECC